MRWLLLLTSTMWNPNVSNVIHHPSQFMIHNNSEVYVAVKNKHYLYFEHAFSEDPLGHCVQVSLKTSQYSTRSNGSCKNRNTIFLANSQFLITSSRRGTAVLNMCVSVLSSWISNFHWEQTRSSWPTFHVEDLYWWYQLGFWPNHRSSKHQKYFLQSSRGWHFTCLYEPLASVFYTFMSVTNELGLKKPIIKHFFQISNVSLVSLIARSMVIICSENS